MGGAEEEDEPQAAKNKRAKTMKATTRLEFFAALFIVRWPDITLQGYSMMKRKNSLSLREKRFWDFRHYQSEYV